MTATDTNANFHQQLVLLSIVTWNHERTIGATLDSILQQTHQNYQVVIFDNGSTDGTREVVQQYTEDSRFLLISNSENIGFCGGHNAVLAAYKAPYVLLVNPDVVLTATYLEKTLPVFAIDSKIGAVCGLLLQSAAPDPVIDSTGMKLERSRRFTMINHGLPLASVQLNSGYVAGLDGALPMFRQEAIQALLVNGNFFIPLFFAHKEDWDVSWRLVLYGWKTYFNKESVAIHPRHFRPNRWRERLQLNKRMRYDAFKNQLLLLSINEDRINFLKDSVVIVPRMVAMVLFCILFERQSLRAFGFLLTHRREILKLRKQVQSSRRVSPVHFRKLFHQA